MSDGWVFSSPPGWLTPEGFRPPEGWTPDPVWPPAPVGWNFWLAAPVVAPTPPVQPSASAPEPVYSEQAQSEIAVLQARVRELETQLASAAGEPADLVELNDERALQDVGIYRYHHPLENAVAFKARLAEIQEDIKSSVKESDAVLASDMFTFNNSLARGRKMTADLSTLMLRAYNAEADNAVRSLRAGNVQTAVRRLEACMKAVERLGKMMEMRVNPDYHELRIAELELTADYLMKVQEEKEAEREERARLREERKVEKELAAERERLNREHSHLENAIAALREMGDLAAIAELEARLSQIDEAIVQNDFRAANIRAGYVYVISNPGTFGPGVVKIGLTRRLEPMDRVRELGGASVPFPFDVHAIFFSEDAVTLENELHKQFGDRRLNHVNQRREFFFVTPAEVESALAEKAGGLLEFVERPESTEFNRSRPLWPAFGG